MAGNSAIKGRYGIFGRQSKSLIAQSLRAGLQDRRARSAAKLASGGSELDASQEPREATSVDVEIFGSVYHVRGGAQNREYLQKLASVVDRKMREIGRHLPTVDAGKIAILAALNLADELLQCNQQQEGERAAMIEKVSELAGELKAALDNP